MPLGSATMSLVTLQTVSLYPTTYVSCFYKNKLMPLAKVVNSNPFDCYYVRQPPHNISAKSLRNWVHPSQLMHLYFDVLFLLWSKVHYLWQNNLLLILTFEVLLRFGWKSAPLIPSVDFAFSKLLKYNSVGSTLRMYHLSAALEFPGQLLYLSKGLAHSYS